MTPYIDIPAHRLSDCTFVIESGNGEKRDEKARTLGEVCFHAVYPHCDFAREHDAEQRLWQAAAQAVVLAFVEGLSEEEMTQNRLARHLHDRFPMTWELSKSVARDSFSYLRERTKGAGK